MNRAAAWAACLCAACFLAITAPMARAQQPSSLASVEADLRRTFPGVPVLSSADLADLEKTKRPVLLLDARTEQEFAVSHIDGARRVDPGISSSQFVETFGPDLKGRQVVVYCAVGGRSSTLASRISKVAQSSGADGVYSLQGGIFRWHNEKRPLIGPNGPTDEVHPFSANAARLIERQDGVAYSPGASKAAKP